MKTRLCRFCKAELTQIFIDLGKTPLANSFLTKIDDENKEPAYPLCVYICKECFLVQLEEFESPEKIFSDYAYFSSYSETWLKHAKEYTKMMIKRFKLDETSQVIEIASNDGYLLSFFIEKNIPVLGIEPAANVAKTAKEKGIETIVEFFDDELSKKIVKTGLQADLIVGNNVLAHVPNLIKFIQGLKVLLKPNGIITLEFPHLLQLINQNQFDTIYHEHFSYFSFFVVQKIFAEYKLKIFDVDELTTHGGSLRIYLTHEENRNLSASNKVKILIDKEKKFGLFELSKYENFSNQVHSVKQELCNFLNDSKEKGKKTICYGAPAKGNTLLNYCKINTDYIEYTVDRNPHKQGLYLPGSHISIKNTDTIRETKPDYVLILPWNLKNEIMNQLSYIRDWGGKFVIPIPRVKVC